MTGLLVQRLGAVRCVPFYKIHLRSGHRRGHLLFCIVHPAFPLPTTASLTLHGALKDGLGEAVMACDMPEPRKFPSLDSC